jgi:hypothetical protein
VGVLIASFIRMRMPIFVGVLIAVGVIIFMSMFIAMCMFFLGRSIRVGIYSAV